MNHSVLFGPVPSRRLGLSLGVDLVPYKTCCLDCVYCESGRTTELTLTRSEFFPVNEVISELEAFLSKNPAVDFITFSGAGEPMLYSEIGRVIAFLKGDYPDFKTCLLTNGMLLTDKNAASEVIPVDLIVPSLDAPDKETFTKINRPVPGFEFDRLIPAYRDFHKSSDAGFNLEIFILPGVNDTDECISGFMKAVDFIRPDKVQLNSLDRPGTEAWVEKMTEEKMLSISEKLAGIADVEIIGKFTSASSVKGNTKEKYENLDSRIMDIITRRPCTIDDIKESLGFSADSVGKVLRRMRGKGLVVSEMQARGEFYRPADS